jgi:ATP-dependent DNA ligase
MITKALARAKRIEPHFIEPMYTSAVRELPDGGAWTYEAKLDGYRCLAAKRQGGVTLWSRRGTLFTARFPMITRACEKLPSDTLIDGEVIAIDESGRASFNALQHTRPNAHIQFYAFDMLIHRGRDVLRLPLETRRELLTDALRKIEYPVCSRRSSPRNQPISSAPQRSLSLRVLSLSVKARSTSQENAMVLGSSTRSTDRRSS